MSSTDCEPMLFSDPSVEVLTPVQHLERFFKTPVLPMVGVMGLFLAAFGNLVNIALDKNVVAIDKQVIVKLAVLAMCGIYGAIGFTLEPRVRRLLLSFPVMWMVIIFGFYLLAVPGSVTQTESLASAISIICVLLMTVTCLVQLGIKTVLNTIFFATSLFIILSWLAYLWVPSIGVFYEPTADGQFTKRMSGLAHSNTLGQFSGILIVLGVIMYRNYKLMSWFRASVMLLAAVALVLSLSRTSLLATVLALVVGFRQNFLRREYFNWMIWLGLIGGIVLVIFSLNYDVVAVLESKLTFLSKSGETEELTSATGRAEIWAYTIQMIGERPLTGYGAATSKYYLEDYSLYTHNMLLNVAFSTGVIGGLAALLMILGRVRALFTRPHAIADGLLAFLLLNGIFENVMFSILAGMPTILWIVAISIPSLDVMQDEHPETLTVRSRDNVIGRAR